MKTEEALEESKRRMVQAERQVRKSRNLMCLASGKEGGRPGCWVSLGEKTGKTSPLFFTVILKIQHFSLFLVGELIQIT